MFAISAHWPLYQVTDFDAFMSSRLFILLYNFKNYFDDVFIFSYSRARPFVVSKQMYRLMALQSRQYQIQLQVWHDHVLPLPRAFAWPHLCLSLPIVLHLLKLIDLQPERFRSYLPGFLLRQYRSVLDLNVIYIIYIFGHPEPHFYSRHPFTYQA